MHDAKFCAIISKHLFLIFNIRRCCSEIHYKHNIVEINHHDHFPLMYQEENERDEFYFVLNKKDQIDKCIYIFQRFFTLTLQIVRIWLLNEISNHSLTRLN